MSDPGRVIYVGHAYYNTWYLSRALREMGWRADVLNWDASAETDLFYHGEDFRIEASGRKQLRLARQAAFYARAVRNYDIFHFSNAHGMQFGHELAFRVERRFSQGAEIRLLKRLGKKIVYSNNGCLDGVAQSSFAAWGDRPVCNDCPWRNVPIFCSDERNLAWGGFRNEVADFQVIIGGNRVDYNVDPTIHEVPEFYCLDTSFWQPDLLVPANYRLGLPDTTIKIYHSVGNALSRTEAGTNRNLKSTHLYLPLIEELKREGHDVELIFFTDVPNKQLRFYQAQADIVVDMLTYGWFGANAREAMMLGKPVVCYLRDEWLDQMHAEVPGYVDELPIVNATPDTVHDVLVDLIEHPEKRAEIGRRSRAFAVKWHSAEAGARRFDRIYRNLIDGRAGDVGLRGSC